MGIVIKDNGMVKEELLAKFLQGECAKDELLEVKRWMDESDEQASELFEIEELYQLGKIEAAGQSAGLEQAEDRLFRRLQAECPRKVDLRGTRRWMQYAAMLIGIFLLGGVAWMAFQERGIWSEPLLAVSTGDAIRELSLPDGTRVWLNKHTSFRYPEAFDADRREVYLEGEGYFEVAKNPEQPFVVHSDVMQVKVLGTVFNLKTDKKQRSAVATLQQGEIEVKGNHDEGGIILAPRQQAELDGEKHRLVVRQLTTGIENWHNSSFTFDSADIFTIGRTLEKNYGVDLVLSSDLNTKSTYSGVLMKSAHIEDVLKSINNVIPVRYKIEGRTVYLSAEPRP